MKNELMEKLAEAQANVAQIYAELANEAMKHKDRHTCARMVRREIEAANRSRAAVQGEDYRI